MPITEQSGFSKVDLQYKKMKMSTEVIKAAQRSEHRSYHLGFSLDPNGVIHGLHAQDKRGEPLCGC
jgi:hypothetical protein